MDAVDGSYFTGAFARLQFWGFVFGTEWPRVATASLMMLLRSPVLRNLVRGYSPDLKASMAVRLILMLPFTHALRDEEDLSARMIVPS